jgi:hypothetical protein
LRQHERPVRHLPSSSPQRPGHEPGTPSGAPAAAQPGTARDRQESPGRYRDLFALGEWRALWSAQVLSLLGDQFARVAITILVYHQTRSPLLTAVAYSVSFLPPVLGGPFLAAVADILPRRRLMIWCDLLRVPLVAAMSLPGISFGPACALLLATVLLGVPFSAARSAMLPDVLPGDLLALGSSASAMTNQLSQIAGFITGATVVGFLGPSRTLLLDAATFAASAAIAARWVRPRPAAATGAQRPRSLWAGGRHGMSLVFGDPALRALVLLGWLAGFYILPEALAVPYSHALHGGPVTAGLLMAAMPAGTAISAAILGRAVQPGLRRRLLGWLAILACLPLAGSAVQPSLAGVLSLWVLSGAGGGYQFIAIAEFLRRLPKAGRGAGVGVAQTGLLAAQGIGFLAGGLAAQAIGVESTVALAGGTGLCAASALAAAWARARDR